MRTREIAGARLIRQWATDTEPVGPIGRIVLTIADLAFEYVGANPAVLGIGGNGEKLIGAVAANLAQMIPEDGETFGPKSQLAEGLIGIFLQAGFSAISAQPQLVVRQAHLEALVKNTLPPIIAALPQDLSDQRDWRDVTEALLGPAASAAIGAIAADPAAFLGASFAADEAIGALTQALLAEASKRGLKGQFSEAGFLAMYRAALGVAAARPELFVGSGDGTAAPALAADLLGRLADTLQRAPVPFNGDLGAQLAGIVLESLQKHAPAFLDPNDPWQTIASAVTAQLADGLAGALATPGGGVLSRAQILELARTVLGQVARTPRMLAGGNTELQTLVRSVAQAMAADRDLLLSAEDWLRIAAAAAEEVAADPQRLLRAVGASAGVPEMTLCAALITDVLSVAAAELAAGGRHSGGILFGATLREAIIVVLRSASGRVGDAVENRPAVKQLLVDIAALARSKPERYGSKELLWLVRALVGRALTKGEVSVTTQLVTKVLAGGVPV
jgi:hypothetical protein